MNITIIRLIQKNFFESSFGYQDLNKLILLLNTHFTHSIAININN